MIFRQGRGGPVVALAAMAGQPSAESGRRSVAMRVELLGGGTRPTPNSSNLIATVLKLVEYFLMQRHKDVGTAMSVACSVHHRPPLSKSAAKGWPVVSGWKRGFDPAGVVRYDKGWEA